MKPVAIITFPQKDKMGMGDEILHAVKVSQRDAKDQHHRKTGVNGTANEVRREERRMPARQLRNREVE